LINNIFLLRSLFLFFVTFTLFILTLSVIFFFNSRLVILFRCCDNFFILNWLLYFFLR